MTASGSGAPGRESTTDEPSRRGFAWQILAILVIGLLVRLMMAYGFDALRGSGFKSDLQLFQFWATNLAQHGPFGFYERDFFADYTPGYLYALWLVGIVGQLVGGVGDLIKLPAIITDVVLAYIVYRMVLDLGVSARRATLAAAVVIINPITWFDSVVWGQVDSFGTVFLLLSVRELWKGRHERAAILAVVAALVKPQLAILVPIVAFVTIRRVLWPAGGYGDEDPPEPSGFGWERRTTGVLRIFSTAVAGFVTAVVLAAPFGLSVVTFSTTAPFVDSSLLRLVFSTAATYSYVTVNAYNLWALFPVNGESTATNGQWIPDAPNPDGAAWAAIGPIPAAVIGGLVLGALLFVVIPWLVARRPDRLTILVGVAALSLAFFAVPTRVHERYLFPLFGIAAILFAFSFRWRVFYVVVSIATFLNMYVVLTTLYPDNPSIQDWLGIGGAIRSFWGVAIIAAVNTAALVFGLLQLRDGARRSLAAELEAGRLDDDAAPATVAAPAPAGDPLAPAALPLAAGATGTALERASGGDAMPAPGGITAAAVAVDAGARRVPAWFDRRSWSELGPIAWLRARVAETPIRPDRSRLLAREGSGRLDRLDLWLLIVLVIAGMGLRMFRLDEPARMHFDEVYHARTAAEFLQYWRYGISHPIYEWTHPHLAKYAMAGGIVAFAGHDVAASSELGLPVRDAAIEPRRTDPLSNDRAGDRVWIATGSELAAYDLQTRALEVSIPVPGASAVAFDTDGSQVYVGTDSGELLAIDATLFDDARSAGGSAAPDALSDALVPVAMLDGAISRLAVFDGGQAVAALLPGDVVSIIDPGSGAIRGSPVVAGAADMIAAGTADAITITLADVEDVDALATALVSVLGGDEATYAALLATPDVDVVTLDVPLTTDVRTNVNDAITAGTLPGVAITAVPVLAVAGTDGVTLVTTSGTIATVVDLAGGATGVALVSGVDDGTQMYATTTDESQGTPEVAVISLTGDDAKDGPSVRTRFELPGAGYRILYDVAAEMVEVLGERQDGGGMTIYVVEPHGKSVFADHELPFVPSAWVLDHNEDYPTLNRGAILAFAEDGATASVDISHYHFAWRLPGVIAGALTIGIVFLLARVLFRRREVAVLAGLFVLLDGMFFVQSRIAMNDVYTGLFILMAYLLFAWLWVERRRARAFWVLMPAIGVLLGLALASKWVAAYAIGALGILVLIRSALGRIILIAGLVVITGLLGWMAMAVPANSDASGNLLFPLIMVALTLAAVVITVYHPISWSDEEVRLAVGGPPLLGILLVLASIALGRADTAVTAGPLKVTPLELGFALVLLGGAAYAAFQVGGRYGMGPMAPTPQPGEPRALVPPPSPPAEGWLRLGSGLGLPIVWMVLTLIAIPLGVYVALYIPWALIDNHQLVAGWPPGHTGQTLIDLTGEMYRYHNNLTAAHAASSPWWAWPLNLKPVWFYQGSFADSTAASIYDAGNMVIWWLGIPAMVFVAIQAFRRQSLPLALILIGFLCQWVSWARIDRAAFQYHYYTSLPFIVLALAYFVAELWHGASRRTWLAARVAAAVALMGPVILWLLRQPLCAIANVESVNPGSQACNGNPGNLVVTPAAAAMVVIGIVTVVVLIRLLVALARPPADGRERTLSDFGPLVMTALAGGALLALTRLLPSEDPLFSFPGIVPEIIALVVGVPLLIVATQVVTARDARRFVIGLVSATAFWFVFIYPNISALPLPATMVNAYQGLVPTYLYAFQFGVNTIDRSGSISFQDPRFAMLMLFLLVACAVVAYSARMWRMALADDVPREGSSAAGPAGEAGSA